MPSGETVAINPDIAGLVPAEIIILIFSQLKEVFLCFQSSLIIYFQMDIRSLFAIRQDERKP